MQPLKKCVCWEATARITIHNEEVGCQDYVHDVTGILARWPTLMSAFAVAASLDHRTQQMDGPPAAKMKQAVVGE